MYVTRDGRTQKINEDTWPYWSALGWALDLDQDGQPDSAGGGALPSRLAALVPVVEDPDTILDTGFYSVLSADLPTMATDADLVCVALDGAVNQVVFTYEGIWKRSGSSGKNGFAWAPWIELGGAPPVDDTGWVSVELPDNSGFYDFTVRRRNGDVFVNATVGYLAEGGETRANPGLMPEGFRPDQYTPFVSNLAHGNIGTDGEVVVHSRGTQEVDGDGIQTLCFPVADPQ